ncbi:MAG: hypothetical protein K2R98_04095 [Gemmataceae bacterium]|nr:hypothetical protein [Gemmataceae bacterium]
MPALRMDWTPGARSQFEALRQRAIDSGAFDQFRLAHNEIALTLQDLDQAMLKGEPLFNTRRSGGVARHWLCQFISVCYVVIRDEQVGWMIRNKPVPETWPF